MKRSFFSFLFLLAVSVLFTNAAFASVNPVPGVDVVVKKHPGAAAMPVVHTDNSGDFKLDLPAGDYDLTISYAGIVKAMSGVKTFDPNSITLSLSSTDAKSNIPSKVTINKSTETITITIHAKSATLSGTLTYEPLAVKAAPAAGKR